MNNQHSQAPPLPTQQTSASLIYKECANETVQQIEEFYLQAYISCEQYFKDNQIQVYDKVPNNIPEVNRCFLVKKKDNKVREMLYAMCVTFNDQPKKQTKSFKYMDGKQPNSIKVRIVEAHNSDVLQKIGIKEIKFCYLIHTYLSTDHILYSDQQQPQQQNAYQSNNDKNAKQIPYASVQSNPIGFNGSQIGLDNQKFQQMVDFSLAKQYPVIQNRISFPVSDNGQILVNSSGSNPNSNREISFQQQFSLFNPPSNIQSSSQPEVQQNNPISVINKDSSILEQLNQKILILEKSNNELTQICKELQKNQQNYEIIITRQMNLEQQQSEENQDKDKKINNHEIRILELESYMKKLQNMLGDSFNKDNSDDTYENQPQQQNQDNKQQQQQQQQQEQYQHQEKYAIDTSSYYSQYFDETPIISNKSGQNESDFYIYHDQAKGKRKTIFDQSNLDNEPTNESSKKNNRTQDLSYLENPLKKQARIELNQSKILNESLTEIDLQNEINKDSMKVVKQLQQQQQPQMQFQPFVHHLHNEKHLHFTKSILLPFNHKIPLQFYSMKLNQFTNYQNVPDFENCIITTNKLDTFVKEYQKTVDDTEDYIVGWVQPAQNLFDQQFLKSLDLLKKNNEYLKFKFNSNQILVIFPIEMLDQFDVCHYFKKSMPLNKDIMAFYWFNI